MDIEHIAEQYGLLAAVLDRDHEVPGAAGIFGTALSCGLAAIVKHTWPGDEEWKGKVKSPRWLLQVARDKAKQDPDGKDVWIIHGDADSLEVRIDAGTLVEAIDYTDAIRHARGVGELKRPYVDALLELDSHPALLQVMDQLQKSDWVKEVIRERHDRLRATDYLHLIGDEEADRRTEAAIDDWPSTPQGDDEMWLDTCPLCDRETLAVSGVDTFGVGIGPGTCLVCSYVRSPDAAEEIARDIMWDRHMDD